jgi:prophage maintenance system killer protein
MSEYLTVAEVLAYTFLAINGARLTADAQKAYALRVMPWQGDDRNVKTETLPVQRRRNQQSGRKRCASR